MTAPPISTMNISSSQHSLPPLPSYTLSPLPSLLPPIPDKLLTLLLPIAAYWGLSMFFHWIDVNDYFSAYRLHTPAEVLKRNHVSRWEVVRDVIIQQVVQTAVGWVLGMTEPDDFAGQDDYNVAVWARRIRVAQGVLPGLLALVGVDALGVAKNLAGSHAMLAGALAGGKYPQLVGTSSLGNGLATSVPRFADWETLLAKALYWYLAPAMQFSFAILIVDTWQYFLHRLMHVNKWLYTTFHSRHHRLYVPYAFGALYNHPFEGFLLDTLGASIAFKAAGLSTRQGMVFFTGSTFKTVDDHCGYALPWDPLQHITSNNAGYHDVHHQSWGIKTNFSQPFFTFWDRWLGTVWTGGDVSARYERSRLAAQKKFDADMAQQSAEITKSSYPKAAISDLYASAPLPSPLAMHPPSSPFGNPARQAISSREQVLDDRENGGLQVLREEEREEKEAKAATVSLRKSPRKRTQSESLKGLREMVTGGGSGRHGGRVGILGVEEGL